MSKIWRPTDDYPIVCREGEKEFLQAFANRFGELDINGIVGGKRVFMRNIDGIPHAYIAEVLSIGRSVKGYIYPDDPNVRSARMSLDVVEYDLERPVEKGTLYKCHFLSGPLAGKSHQHNVQPAPLNHFYYSCHGQDALYELHETQEKEGYTHLFYRVKS